jgi:hypothetical protein
LTGYNLPLGNTTSTLAGSAPFLGIKSRFLNLSNCFESTLYFTYIGFVLITVASVIIGRFDNFSVDSMRWVLLLAFGLCSLVSIVSGIKNYNNYRKSFVKLEKKEEKEVKDSNSVEAPGVETTIIIDENNNDKPQNYVS